MIGVGFTILIVLLAAGPPGFAGEPTVPWRELAPGLDLVTIVATAPTPVGDGQITVLRADPHRWELTFVGKSLTGEPTGHTARQWAQAHGLTVCINAGMFATDYSTHLGYLRYGDHLNSRRVNDYQSVAAFDPYDSADPPFRIFDRDAPDVTMEGIRESYASVVQNLRLIKRPGENRWSRQDKMWSEAALGEDRDGNILFVFTRSPFSMHDLNRQLLASDIGLVAAQHLEGGPEAQLYVHAGELELELFGSYETSFNENDDNDAPWAVPNVLGVRPRP